MWTVARWVVLLVTVGLIASFWIWPSGSLSVLWYVLIPVLPAVFLINVELWRNVCPLATLNVLTGSSVGTRVLGRNLGRVAGVVGILLLAIMVPARRFAFNTDASVLGLTVIAVCLLALVGGLVFDMKGGFCTAVCPVLPVERLYGQRPLLTVPNARCTPCSVCTKAGCLDLNPERSAVIALGAAGRSARWVVTPYGAFALAFPGFVVSYYLLADVAWTEAVSVYASVALWAAGSWFVLAALFLGTRTRSATALLICAGLSVGLYYWFAPPGIATAFGLSGWFVWPARAAALSLVGFWLARALRTAPGSGPNGRALGRA